MGWKPSVLYIGDALGTCIRIVNVSNMQ